MEILNLMKKSYLFLSIALVFFSDCKPKEEDTISTVLPLLAATSLTGVRCDTYGLSDSGYWANPSYAEQKSPYVQTIPEEYHICSAAYKGSTGTGTSSYVTFDYPAAGEYEIRLISDEVDGFDYAQNLAVLKQDIETLYNSAGAFLSYEADLAGAGGPFDATGPGAFGAPFDTIPPVCNDQQVVGEKTCTDVAVAGQLRRSALIYRYSINNSLNCTGCTESFKGRIIIKKKN
ncbi:hypothetical protein EHQ12_07340 [Leptospira gomenensis]|uniref:Uncharacterized protein n=1 Tax=Leptospira gomenensis TaxID=2484974 RepID=A0A5F1Z130_9LEPT|nr:hypothetical protein [Leptospira gomenensis]TGK35481.1 hypothetical protein EHQ17_05975 [Leptospira gomenensis]TGK40627.1 hypothetical protein EHQ12_07340 [Leptospira gomenensis]TGK46305.1 hypothetical protein EHQ07_06510 [Leptospira gomenensis]TGK66440.1 hypothetical protein EHQ13_02915 [Leptospira gomenensis]